MPEITFLITWHCKVVTHDWLACVSDVWLSSIYTIFILLHLPLAKESILIYTALVSKSLPARVKCQISTKHTVHVQV